MNNKLLIICLLCVITIKLNAQEVYITEDENNIYWQPDAKIDFSDYQSPINEDCLRYKDKYGVTMVSSIGVRGVVDIPKKRRKHDKFYVAPVFCKNCSCIFTKDSLSLKVDHLLFDIAELYARRIRIELRELYDEMKTSNTYVMFFTTVKNKWDKEMYSVSGSVITQVLINKKDSAYFEWRQAIDGLLKETEQYATKPEDCYRFVLGEPVEKGYKMAKTIVGDMRNREEE